jgi:hypothetical protein
MNIWNQEIIYLYEKKIQYLVTSRFVNKDQFISTANPIKRSVETDHTWNINSHIEGYTQSIDAKLCVQIWKYSSRGNYGKK